MAARERAHQLAQLGHRKERVAIAGIGIGQQQLALGAVLAGQRQPMARKIQQQAVALTEIAAKA